MQNIKFMKEWKQYYKNLKNEMSILFENGKSGFELHGFNGFNRCK